MKEITVILTVWKRNHLEEQLIALLNQSKKPNIIWVQQTMKHVEVSDIIEKYQSYIKYSYFTENRGVFGRFESVSEVETEFTFILDDDMIPGKNYVKNVLEASVRLNGIISSSGRRVLSNNHMSYVGDILKSGRSYCKKDMQVDFGTHSWFFRTQWIEYFFQIPAYTIFNGEDMHISATCKIFGDINTYVPTQASPDDSGNTKCNYSADEFALHRKPCFQHERFEIIKYLSSQGWTLLKEHDDFVKKKKHRPCISVILPIYNICPDYLKESVGSILSQTFTNFELLIISNEPNDNCMDMLSNFHDERIWMIKNQHNFNAIFNIALKESKGKYIAWMDTDNIMLQNRLHTQYDFMESYLEIDICGSWAEQFGFGNEIIKPPKNHDSIISSFISANKMFLSSVMMRKESFEEIQYSGKYLFVEDYKLLTELALKGFRFANIPTILLKYRVSKNPTYQNYLLEVSEATRKIQLEYIEKIIEQMAKQNETYEIGLNSIIDMTNNGLVSWKNFKQFVSNIYSDFLKKDA